MSKRFANRSQIPIVEKLYRENQESYHAAGGFDAADDDYAETRERITEAVQKKRDREFEHISAPDKCIECNKPLYDSFLWEKFNHAVCDLCSFIRDDAGRHKLITRTEAKKDFLLKDCDLDLRKPLLRFISKKNPHNPRYGDMKLYLKLQIENRALEIYESWDNLEEVRDQKNKYREVMVEKRFEKKIRQMRKEICGAPQLQLSAIQKHEHEFNEEVYNKKEDQYSKTCKICGFCSIYEKM